jgi:hypothetical protein
MDVPHYEPRNVEIRFENGDYVPVIKADGPGSPHRYANNGSLCLWHPDAAADEKWVFEDGLLALLNHVQAHLFREAWWRETGEWLGPEASHGPPKQRVQHDERVDRVAPHPRR